MIIFRLPQSSMFSLNPSSSSQRRLVFPIIKFVLWVFEGCKPESCKWLAGRWKSLGVNVGVGWSGGYSGVSAMVALKTSGRTRNSTKAKCWNDMHAHTYTHTHTKEKKKWGREGKIYKNFFFFFFLIKCNTLFTCGQENCKVKKY